MNLDLEKDGLVSNLYYLLWKKESCLSADAYYFDLRIPHTIIFKNNVPYSWYFSNKEGKLMR